MNFRESINNLIRSDKPESTSRALALVTGLFLLAWVTYIIQTSKIESFYLTLIVLVGYICTLLGVKQYNERKEAEDVNPNP